MVIPIPTGNRYTATVHGRILKEVPCEHCGTKYFYLMERSAVGEGHSPLFLDNRGASERAENRARADLKKRLEGGCDPCPCPGCGRLQANMVKSIRAKRLKAPLVGGILLAAFGGLIAWAVMGPMSEGGFVPAYWRLIACSLPAAGLALLVFAVLRFRYDPNSDPPAIDRYKRENGPRTMTVDQLAALMRREPVT